MEDLFEKVTTIASISAGVGSLLGMAVSVIRNRYAQKRKLKKAEEETISSVLAEDDITTLGAYVDNVIGPFNMREYATNSEVERKVDAYIERVQEYIGNPEDIERERGEAPPQMDPPPTHDSQFPHEFQPILEELRFGESWNALARLRRYIEVTLKKIAEQTNLPIERVSSVGRLLTLLEKRQVIDSQIALNLRYPISVSNRAIHGEDVSQGEAEEAIFYTAKILQSLET